MIQVVEPIVARHILHPGVIAATVVEDHIHHHLHALLVRLVDQSLIILIRTEARIYPVVVGRGVAVIGAPLHVVLQDGIQPNSGHTQILDII